MEEIALLIPPPISNLWECGLQYQSPSALPLLAQVLIRIVDIKDYPLLRWKCSYSMGMGLVDDTYPDNGNRLCRRVSCDMPSLHRCDSG